MKNRFNISKKSIALLAAAVVLFSSGGFLATQAAPSVVSPDHVTDLVMDELEVALYENGHTISEGKLSLDNFAKTDDGKVLVSPGKKYEEKLTVKNNKSYDQYVRMVIRKYWVDANGNKTTALDPSMIDLTYGSDWQKNDKECTAEMEIWYYKQKLKGNATTSPAVTFVSIKPGVVDKIIEHDPVTDDKGKMIYTYEYKYNGYSFVINAEAQAVQTHNKDDAIKSTWGIDASETPIG